MSSLTSIAQRSVPREKKRVLPTSLMLLMSELLLPGVRSATRVVPALVPSLFQSSLPLMPLSAVK